MVSQLAGVRRIVVVARAYTDFATRIEWEEIGRSTLRPYRPVLASRSALD